MKAFAAICAAGAVLGTLALQEKIPPPPPGWHSDLPAALAEAGKNGRPVMAVFRCMP